MHQHLLHLSLALGLSLTATPAEAACVDSSTNACDGGGTTDVCLLTTTFNPDDTVTCNLDRNGSGNGSDVHAVLDTVSGEIHVFGTDAADNDFCCQIVVTTTADVYMSINGDNTNVADVIDLNYSGYELKNLPGYDLTCNVFGKDGDDTITGSDDAAGRYYENLSGGGGGDTIRGGNGIDHIDGNDGNDFLYGDGSHDTIQGGAGDDQIWGGAGDDTLYGDLDSGAGTHGVDKLYGEDGYDVLCSGGRHTSITGEEVLSGGLLDDIIWGGVHTSASSTVGDVDTLDGDGGTDDCDANAYVTTVATCEAPRTSPAPSECW